jgi:hypothetical protein
MGRFRNSVWSRLSGRFIDGVDQPAWCAAQKRHSSKSANSCSIIANDVDEPAVGRNGEPFEFEVRVRWDDFDVAAGCDLPYYRIPVRPIYKGYLV